MVFKLDSYGPYCDIRVPLENVLEVCDWYGLFLQSDKFSVKKAAAFKGYFGLKNTLRSLNEIFVVQLFYV